MDIEDFGDLAIFFTSDTYKLDKYYEFFKSELLPVIIVDLNTSNSEYKNFSLINFKDLFDLDSPANRANLKNLQTLILSVLGIKNEYFNLKTFDFSQNLDYWSTITENNNPRTNNQLENVEKLFMIIDNKSIRVIDGNRCIGKIEVDSNDIDYEVSLACWIEHLNQVLLIHRNSTGTLYDKHGNLLRRISEFSIRGLVDRYCSVDYCRKNRTIYYCEPNEQYRNTDTNLFFFDTFSYRWKFFRPLKGIRGINIKIFGDFIYIVSCSWNDLYVYDLKFQCIAVIKNNSRKWEWLSPISESANYLFQDNLILNTKTFTFMFNNLKPEWPEGRNLQTIHKDKFILSGDKVYKINMNSSKSKNFIDDKFLCKINPFRYHLLRNPLVLPCGNMICNDCFYENFNLYLNIFICNYELCQRRHEINSLLNPNNQFIENSCGDILKMMIDNYKTNSIDQNSKL
jgi:hypothetical protein